MMYFPVLHPPKGCAKFVLWDVLDPLQAWKNHQQTLRELANRGGLSPEEIYANVNSLKFSIGKQICTQEDAVKLVNSIASLEQPIP